MDPEIKAKWIAALRSGEYKQGTGRLYDDLTGRFCCLGVLCEVQNDDFLDRYAPTFTYSYLDYEHAAGLLTEQMKHLAIMNDGGMDASRFYSFAEIADYVEKNL